MDVNVTLPSVAERLQGLDPSKELLEFYRKRLSTYENEDGKVMSRLSEFKLTCDNQYALEKDLMERDEENAALRKALSDMQAALYQEREHVLRIYAENDRLKIRELEDRKKIQHLLQICGTNSVSVDVGALMKDYSENVGIPNKTSQKTRPQTLHKTVKPVNEFDSSEFFKLQIDGLKAELEEQSKFASDNIEAVTEDLRVTRAEAESQHEKDARKIASLNDKLKKAQDLLAKITEDYLFLKRAHNTQEQSWLAQRDEMAIQIRNLKRASSNKAASMTNLTRATSTMSLEPSGSRPLSAAQSHQTLPLPVKVLPTTQSSNRRNDNQAMLQNLDKANKLCETYKSQCMNMEEELSQLREEKDASKSLYNERSEKLSNQLKVISGRYKDLEKRHKLEVEGFKNDVKILKTHLEKVEKQLLRTAIKLTQTQSDADMLQSIHNTTNKSKYISDNLRTMKAQISQLEQDLRLV